jgi:N-acyl-D-aspartate/D-glutamate deacylase
VRHLGIRDGLVAAISESPLPAGPDTRVIDATGRWVMPGFIDLHTHYDAEVELAPSLSESVRHGVTSVMVGRLLAQPRGGHARGPRGPVLPGGGHPL